MKRYVIIGNGVAAAGCIEGIRSVDPDGEITVISEENHEVYCRPLISYYLEGKTDLSRMRYRSEDFYDRMRCRVLYGRRNWMTGCACLTMRFASRSVRPRSFRRLKESILLKTSIPL